MSAEQNLDKVPGINSRYRLQYEESQQAWVMLYPEGMVKLNESAAEILKRCDSQRNVSQIVALLESDFGEKDLQSDVVAFIDIALEQKWIKLDDA